MAARWGTGDETLTACNMEFFPMDTLDETAVLSSGETLEALQSCLDPSILSLFEDTPTIETKGIDEESEATLLTALTEILDNVDDENLSPFDTLPDSELLSGHKGREHSPLRRLLCLSRSPPEKDTLCGARPSSIGKSLPRIRVGSLQRSDGEEEEDGSLTLSPIGQGSSPDNNLLDWGSLTVPLPVTFEQEGENGVSVSLGDFVRQMHPYCMAICVENEEGEQLLPEGGILLEVVDQGENGEPILAIPDVDLPVYLPHKEQSSDNEKKLSNEEDVASDSSEHIVVDDEDITLGEAPVKNAAHVMPNLHPDMKDEMIIKRQKGEIKEKSPSRRKKKKKCKERCQPKPVEGRVLRNGTVRNTIHESPKKPDKRSVNKEKKHNLSKVPLVSAPSAFALKPNKPNPCQTKVETEISTTTVLPETKVQVATSVSLRQEAALLIASAKHSHPSCLPTAVQSQKPDEKPEQPAPAPEKVEVPSAAPSTVMPPASLESPAAAPSPMTPPVSEALPSPVSEPEPKPKPLSLAEYRRLRQQKKLTPVESQENLNSSKWPSLPELPKELLPIPCLPDPSPRDPRRHNLLAAKKEVDEVRPAWQPRGPCAPPTPEALLVPPAYMVSSSSRVSAAAPAPKTQKTPEHAKPSLTQKPSSPAPNSAKNLSPHQHTTAVSSVPQSSGAPASLNPDTMLSADGKCSPALSGEKARDDEKPQSQPVSPKSVELTKTCPATTTEPIKPTAAPMSALSSSKKITVVFQKGSEVTAPTLTDNSITSGSKPTKPATNGTRIASGTRPTDSQSLKAELVVLETKGKPTTAVKPQRTKSPTQELVEAFTSEIGIEAADLTSLLEQFEETQAKEEQCKLEVSGRAAAVGNSSVNLFPEKTVVERVRANDLSSTAALTPPGTPPHQMWKPLAPVALLRKSKATEASKSSPARVIQIDARPLPAIRSRSRPTFTTVTPEVACMDHDYCLPNKGAGEPGMRWNVKQQSYITIKPIKTTTQSPRATAVLSVQSTTNGAVTTKTQDFSLTEPLDHRTDEVQRSSVLETPDASPAWQEADDTVKEGSPKKGPFGKTCRRHAASRTPSPRSGPKERTGGQSRKRSHRSPSPMSSHSESDSLSSRSRSRSHSPSKKRYRPRHSSSSSSSSRSSSRSSVSRSPPRRRRYSYSSSRSGSWSRSRSRSQSPQRRSRWSRSRRLYRSSYRPSYGHSTKPNMEKMKKGKEKAIEERRVVYVGRIRGTMTQKELRERFSLFGDIEDCTLHFRDHGDNYGFVTYYETKDAFTAIENGSKLRKPDELPFDLCFGGRRQFCRTSYADLDSIREFDPLPAKGKFHALDFDTLLKQAQQNLKR